MNKREDVLAMALGGQDKIYEDIVNENYENRIIIVNEEINKSTIEYVNEYILKWNKEDRGLPVEHRKPIILKIATYGGLVSTGFNLIDIIELSKTPVYGVVMDVAYSMGGLILLACHKRYAFKNSTVLLHDGSSGGYGSTAKMRDIARFTEEQEERIKNYIMGKTNISEELYEEKYGREWYMYASEAKELGLIDGIIGEDIDLEEVL